MKRSSIEELEGDLDPEWVSGFTDAEGCFSLYFTESKPRYSTTGKLWAGSYKTGWQIGHEFVITQSEDNLEILKRIQAFFGGAGGIYTSSKQSARRVYHYKIKDRKSLMSVVIPHFLSHGLHTTKAKHFQVFSEVVKSMDKGEHLSHEGLRELALKAEKINFLKKRSLILASLNKSITESSSQESGATWKQVTTRPVQAITQERPITSWWITGFIDGDGSLGYTGGRGGTHYPRLVISQSERSRGALIKIQLFWGAGKLGTNMRNDNHWDNMLRLDLAGTSFQEIVIPFLTKYPLQTNKYDQFEHILELLERNPQRLYARLSA